MQNLIQACSGSVEYAAQVFKCSQKDMLLKICQLRHIETKQLSLTVIFLVKQLQLGIDEPVLKYLLN